MRLLLVLPFLAIGLTGCTNYISGATDPFFGRTRVLPPATGSAAASDPAYSTRAMAGVSTPPPAVTTAPSAPPAFVPSSVAKAPAARTAPIEANADAGRSIVPVSKSNVPLNVATPLGSSTPIASRSAVTPVAPMQPITPKNPVTVDSSTTYTYTPSGNPYASRVDGGFRPGSTRVYSSTSRPGPGPRMTKTRVTPPSLSDHLHKPRANTQISNSKASSIAPSNTSPSNVAATTCVPSASGWRATSQGNSLTGSLGTRASRARTYGQLGQVCIDSSGSASGASATSSAVACAQPPYRMASRAGSSMQPGRINLPNNVIDIMDLPPKRSGTSTLTPNRAPASTPSSNSPFRAGTVPAGASAPVRRDSAVRQASAISELENPYTGRRPQANKPVSFATPSRSTMSNYDHAENHAWLKGRLEYSQARHLWKLRYIPIDGQADEYGGSVILRKTSLLSGFERGDYVQVNGRLIGNSTSGDFAPEYELTQIRRIER